MAWHKVFAFGLLTSAIAIGCTVTSDDDPNEFDSGGGDSGGSTSAGGKGGSGGGSGGSGGGKGGSGGKAGSGGSGGMVDAGPPPMCEPEMFDEGTCNRCVQEKCCTEWQGCTDECGSTGLDGGAGELECVVNCMYEVEMDMGAVTVDDLQDCAGGCAMDGTGLAMTTNAVISCINAEPDMPEAGADADAISETNCSFECFGLVSLDD